MCALTCTAGLDFLLDSHYKPWLLEVNASPSLAWLTPNQPAATELMYSIKQQMLTDMFALLRLQDRFPSETVGAEGAAAQRSTRSKAAGINPVLLQAASAAYFGSRPDVAELVAQDAKQLAAAVAAAPARQFVEARVVETLQQLRGQHSVLLLQQHQQQVVQVETELQSCGGWQSLLAHMLPPPQQQDTDQLDAAIQAWLQVRHLQL